MKQTNKLRWITRERVELVTVNENIYRSIKEKVLQQYWEYDDNDWHIPYGIVGVWLDVPMEDMDN